MNNIEKIELLEHIAIAYKDDETINNELVSPQGRFIKNKELAEAIENLVQENKELRIQISARETVVDKLTKENKELKETLRSEIQAFNKMKELAETIRKENVEYIIQNRQYELHYIPKSKVKEKIEVIQKRMKEETRTDFLITLKILENELQELLEEGE